MFCPKCATQNLDGASFCRSCGANISLIPQALAGQPLQPSMTIAVLVGESKAWQRAESRSRFQEHLHGYRIPDRSDRLVAIDWGRMVVLAIVTRLLDDGHWSRSVHSTKGTREEKSSRESARQPDVSGSLCSSTEKSLGTADR